MSLRRRALFLAGIFVAVSCSDAGNPLEPTPTPKPEVDAIQALQCTVDIRTSSMQCATPLPDAGGAQATQIITGGQRKYVVLTASNFASAATSLELDVTVQNLMRQALGVDSTGAAQENGVRVWFQDEPANATVHMQSGTEMLTTGPTPYFQYDEVLATGQTSAPKRWRFEFAAGVTNIQFFVYVVAHVQHPKGWVEITPNVDTLAPTETVDLSAIAFAPRADSASAVHQTFAWSSSNPTVASVDASTGLVTAHEAGTVTITATNNVPGNGSPVKQSGTATIVVNTEPSFVVQTIDAITNVTIPEPAPGLLQGSGDGDGHTPSVVPGTVVTLKGGTATLAADGSLTYLSPAGFDGRDTIPFELTDGVTTRDAYALVDVAPSNYWYVRADATGDGRDQFPFGTLAAAQAAAGAGDSILVLTNGAQQVNGAVTLGTGQAILGGGIPASITRTVNGQSVTILAGGGSAPGLTNTAAGATITLGTDNIIRGVGITASSGAAIASQPSGFGTLAASELTASATGPVLDLNDGALSAVFTTLSSTGSTGAGLSLEAVTGSLTSTGGAISGSTDDAFEVIGGTVTVTYGGNVSKGSAGALLDVGGNHATGTLTFNGTLSATAGTGLQFNDADGTYAFNGTTTLNGGDAGVDITNGAGGTFTFASGTSITSPSGSAFTVYGASPVVTYSGNITKANAGLLVEIGEQPGGSVTFNTGTLQATAGDGISFSNADGTNAFNGTTTLNGGNAGVDVVSQSSGAITFASGASIANASGIGLHVANGTASTSVTFAGPITAGAGLAAHVEGVSAGAVLVSGAVSGANGIVAQNNTGGTITFSGAKSLSTGAGNAVTLANNTGATISFTNGNTDLTTTTGTAFSATGGGTVNVSGANSDINTTGGTGAALTLNGVTLGASGMEFATVNTGAAAAPVSLTSVGVTSGSAITVGGGSIPAGAGTRFLVSGGAVNVNWAGTISQSTHANSLLSITGGHTGTIGFSAALSASSGDGLQFSNADGTYNLTGTTTLNGGDAGIDLFSDVDGTVNVTPSGGNSAAITSPTGIAVRVADGDGDLIFRGNVTQANNNPLLSISSDSGSVSFPAGTLNASNGNGLQFDNADGAYDFGGTVTLNGGDAGIDVTNGSGGVFTFPVTTTITSPSTGNLISILNSAPSFTYTGGLTKANNNVTGILISGNTGGTITFNGDATSADGDPADVARTISSGTSHAVSLTSNNAATTVTFNGGGLAITTTSGIGINASSGGTLNITGAGNSISSGTGTALNVQNTTIGASGLSFLSIGHSGGTNGIVLQNTGNTNGLQVTGNGGVCTVATPTCTGGVIQGTSGDGVSLSSVTNVSLSLMRVQTAGGSGIYGSSVTGFKLKNGLVNNNGNAVGEAGLEFDGLFGTDSIFNSTVTGSAEDNLVVRNTGGTLDSLVVISSTFSSNSSIGSDGILVTASNAANATVRVRNSTFTANKGDHFQATASNTANMNVVLLQNTMTGGHASALGQGITLTNGLSHSGTFTYDINGNNIPSGPISNAITVAQDGTTGAVMQGRIRNNVIGTSGSALSCSTQGTGIRVDLSNRGTHTTAVTGNTVRRCFDRGIFFDAGDGTNATFNITATGNIVDQQDDAGARDGLRIEAGAFDPNFLGSRDKFTLCAVVGGAAAADKNVLDVGSGGGNPLRARLRFDSRMNMPGYAGPNHNPAGEVETYLAARNTYVAGSGSATTTAASGDAFGFGSAASCPTPP